MMADLTPEHKLLCDVAAVKVHLDKYSRIEQRALLGRVMDHLNAVVEAQRAPGSPARADRIVEEAPKGDTKKYSELFVFYRRGFPVHIHHDRKVFENWMKNSAWLYPPAECEIVRFAPHPIEKIEGDAS